LNLDKLLVAADEVIEQIIAAHAHRMPRRGRRLWHQADVLVASVDVRLSGQGGHRAAIAECP